MNAMNLPDIAAQVAQQSLALEWVGMQQIAVPILFKGQPLPARANVGVSLDDGEARGIHMSRLYLSLEVLEQRPLTPALLREMLLGFLESHRGLSNSAYLQLSFEAMEKRPALISDLSGWKRYPIVIDAQMKNGMFHVELNVEVTYSSTCPCSAALARQLIQQQFEADFSDRLLEMSSVLGWLGSPQGIIATPHSQRSTANLRISLKEQVQEFPFSMLIDSAEAALATPVQTAVKRADEQAFALANGQNLMFCEDAARRLHLALLGLPEAAGFELEVLHAESLHAHDAVARSSWNWRQQQLQEA
ncbi:GTP cyclohydrolase FolE2 [Pseudomonas sp. R5(2019)]|uniref:GTP cyclohydrolase FolE2 n=1 Tax=Pseudomonas sp. R5(2019) TaxID=2697566 RepID=UPI001411D87B|nr:GTP cyclohydrolase FolE2 [Pseudomonas sp. R5(2019)]NBA97052.1 GTP cyclohydrolase I FolE2 [Pseudomonas sp. R5(2019)]